jgi:hypothetical protein
MKPKPIQSGPLKVDYVADRQQDSNGVQQQFMFINHDTPAGKFFIGLTAQGVGEYLAGMIRQAADMGTTFSGPAIIPAMEAIAEWVKTCWSQGTTDGIE